MSDRTTAQTGSRSAPGASTSENDPSLDLNDVIGADEEQQATAATDTSMAERLLGGALPTSLTPFIGRERERAALRDLLPRDDVRLVTLTGPGGIGKTRLALHVASEIAGEFPDGVVYAPLATVQSPAFILPALTQAFGLTESDSLPLMAGLVATLQGRRLLLILDNFEHLVGEAAGKIVAELLVSCSGVTALSTSRTLLHLSGEHAFIVPPLALPRHAARESPAPSKPTLDELRAYDAVQLFVDRSQAAWPKFALTAENVFYFLLYI